MVPYALATLSEVLCLGSYATDKRLRRREALGNNGPVDEGQALMCKLNADGVNLHGFLARSLLFFVFCCVLCLSRRRIRFDL
ncbi:unnamed protein product [Amoebophrya sp. A25]|nr:unnamed protein product [Amoebophrya sp. A25]|eukprot:GSA25T00014171001.1